MKIVIDQCRGIAPRIPPGRLPAAGAQVARNVDVRRQTLQPLRSAGSTAVRLPDGMEAKTIYKWGGTLSERMWFVWDSDVDVCRGQIAGDDLEWTIFTGTGYPKITNANMYGLGNPPELESYEPYEMPAPVTTGSFVFGEGEVSSIGDFALDGWKHARLDIDLRPLEDAFALSSEPVLITDGVIETDNPSADFSGLNAAVNGIYGSLAEFETAVVDSSPPSIYGVFFESRGAGRAMILSRPYEYDGSYEEVMTVSNPFTVTWEYPEGRVGWIDSPTAIRLGLPAPEVPLWVSARGVGALMPIGKEVWTRFDVSAAPSISLDEGGSWDQLTITSNTDAKALYGDIRASLTSLSLDAEVGIARLGDTLFLYLMDSDPTKFLWFKWGTEDEDVFKRSYETSYAESRTYTWTWIREIDGMIMESAPAEPSQMLGVCPLSDVVKLTFPGAVDQVTVPTSEGHFVTGVRIYRSAGGSFLFVAELGLDEFLGEAGGEPFTSDALPSELLGEQMPLTMEPPEGLHGIVNLPNGIIAGFYERDVYFCDPYRPYSWPEAYRLTVDYPIVGLGALDTTLVVLTKGHPYFIQGAHPDSMVMVRSPVQQSCVSKQSIVTFGGAVLYVSPDGLMSLSPGGSSNITESLFTREQWQEWFDIENLHGYTHDDRYHAFHPPKTHQVRYQDGAATADVTLSGFVFDTATSAFVAHDLPYLSGFSDLRSDNLYVLDNVSLRIWNEGLLEPYTWRSKRFDVPRDSWFSWGHVEAYGYPISFRLIVDGEERFTYEVQTREPFRLPVIVGRDWEVELSGQHEVTKITLAQSSQELYGS